MIPQELVFEILLRCPVKTLARCLCVSKLWASTIRSRYFINSYQSRSSTRQPRVLFAFSDRYTIPWRFFLSSLDDQEPQFNPIGVIENTPYAKPGSVNGLICCQGMHGVSICNPSTGKIIPLPPGPSQSFWHYFLGYDPINDQYKVLSFSKRKHRDPFRVEVLALEDQQGSWKKIESRYSQTPSTNGICLDGVVYYGAYMEHGSRLMRFDVRTEEFGDFIEIPDEALYGFGGYLGLTSLMNYQGKPSLLIKKGIHKYELWVLEDVEENKWFKQFSIVITPEMCPFRRIGMGVVGVVASTGEIMVTAYDDFDKFYAIFLDLKTNSSREVGFEGVRCSNTMALAFMDYVESVMFL